MRLGGIHGLCVVGSLGREDKVTWFSESRRDKVGGELLSPGFRQPGKRSSGLGTQV